MKLSQLKPGETILMEDINQPLIFKKRYPRLGTRPAVNLFYCPAYVGQNGPDDLGLCEISDSDVIKRCRPFQGVAL